MRRAKIVATIGPASQSPEMLAKLVEAGMDVARLNFSHGDHESHGKTILHIREASRLLKKPVAIMQDLQGLKIRTGPLEDGSSVELTTGQHFVLTTQAAVGNRERVSASYQALPQDLRPGDRLLLSDGLIELRVLTTTHSDVECEVIAGGTLAENQGINLPNVKISASALTEKDLRDLDFGAEQQIDYLALSFIRRPADILKLKERLAQKKRGTPVIAKLEKPMAIENLDAIMDVCEGVMVARGDLGVEMAPEKVPVIQKHIIAEANKRGKVVITATQMLESMVRHPRPTRAEASDVANAVLDGTDAVMLSAETASGQYPVESVSMMTKIINEVEKIESGRSHRPISGIQATFLSGSRLRCRLPCLPIHQSPCHRGLYTNRFHRSPDLQVPASDRYFELHPRPGHLESNGSLLGSSTYAHARNRQRGSVD